MHVVFHEDERLPGQVSWPDFGFCCQRVRGIGNRDHAGVGGEQDLPRLIGERVVDDGAGGIQRALR